MGETGKNNSGQTFTNNDRIYRDFQINKFNVKKITPAVAMTIEVNVDNLLFKREELNKNSNIHISIYSFLLKEIADILIKYPLLFGCYYKKKIIINDTLILNVPVSVSNHVEYVLIKAPETKSYLEIATELQNGISEIKHGKNLLMNALEEIDTKSKFKGLLYKIINFKNLLYFLKKYYGNFPVTNFGTFNIDNGIAVLSEPIVSALVVGKVKTNVTIKSEKIVKTNIITLNLSFDHRVLDGAYAGKFLNDLKDKIEKL